MRFNDNLLWMNINHTNVLYEENTKRVNSNYKMNKKCFDEKKYFEDLTRRCR